MARSRHGAPRDLSHLLLQPPQRTPKDEAASAAVAPSAAPRAPGAVASASDPVAELAGAVSDVAARRAMRTLPILLPLLRAAGEDLTGAPSRSTRTWLAALPGLLAAAWHEAHAGVGTDLSAAAPALRPPVVAPLRPAPTGGAVASAGPEAAAPALSAASAAAAVAPPDAAAPKILLPSLLCEPPAQLALTGALDAYYHAVARAASERLASGDLRPSSQSPPPPPTHPLAVLENAELRRLEKRADLLLFKKGVVPERDAEALEAARASLDKVRGAVAALADVLDRDMPPLDDSLVEDDDDGKAKGRLTLWLHGGSSDEGGPYGDAVSRSFYEDIPDLRDTVPSILLGEALSAAAASAGGADGDEGGAQGGGARAAGATPRVRANIRTTAKGTLDGALEQFSGRRGTTAAASPAPAPAPAPPPAAAPVKAPSAAPAAVPAPLPASTVTPDAPATAPPTDAAATAALQQQPQLRLVDMLGRLAYCASRDAADSWAADFVMLNYNTRPNRDRLARLICEGEEAGGGAAAAGGRGDADVLPYLARLVAVLGTGIKEFGPAVLELVSKDFVKALRPCECAGGGGRASFYASGERFPALCSEWPGDPRRGSHGAPPPLRAAHRRAHQVPRLRAHDGLWSHPPLHARAACPRGCCSALHAPRALRPLPLPHARHARRDAR